MTTRHLIDARALGFCAPPAAMLVLLGGIGLSGGPALAQVEFGEFDEAEIFFELNATDRDVGLQGLLDGEAWRMVRITGPDGSVRVLRAGTGNYTNFGLTELFFESNEPLLDERSFADLLALFPEGEYHFRGWTIEGGRLVDSAELTADLPCPPDILSPEEEEEEFALNEVTIRWDLVPGVFDPDTETCADIGEAVEPVGVQVVIEVEKENEDEEFLRELSVDLPPADGQFRVPQEFLEGAGLPDPDGETETKVEVVVTEDSGNRTASERSFEVTGEP